MNHKHITIFGEVLFDHFPDGSRVLGGAPFNVAWHLQAFRQLPFFISRVGEDPTGDTVVAAMQKWGLNCSGLQRDNSHATGIVDVAIEQGEPAYTILQEQAYDYIDEAALADENRTGLLYHGTLALRNPVSRKALTALKEKGQCAVFMDVNLREPWWNKTDVLEWVEQADWVKLNHHELAALFPVSGDLEADMRRFRAHYYLEGLIVTSGKKGATAVDSHDVLVTVTPGEINRVIDTVGAGDAFSSVILLGLNQTWPLALTMERAQSFASALIGQRGATVRDHAFYQPFLQSWGLVY
ncbi:PfkB family carbohydrate kinase [Methylicorpusculum sp.]|uniref:PfkB family carbohydrate kinase n=1 Tax=Methylicorpusculum sp. TaxID=2713644 RepID=UPI0027367841|nr:PfkB family carbohydrate kinase [Methylicorpusculum sp.]MDP3531468.1 PfkB family carbohydrate kinase [Methylicorpusculum sp.]MDZ4152078.1 PfkB family carbohydrate kinase [Methylicorpusculum sp.]